MSVAIKKSNSLNKLNLTPMIDVVFQLLIFFLVAARFQEEEQQFPVKVPRASHATALTDQVQKIVITLDKNGGIHAGGELVNRAALEEILRQAVADNPAQEVVIRADEECDVVHVVGVADTCHSVGLTKHSIATQRDVGP